MADIWAASVDFSSVSYTGQTTGLNAFDVFVARYIFVAADLNDGSLAFPAVLLTLHINLTTDLLETLEEHGLTSQSNPLNDFLANAGASFTGLGTAGFTGGGTVTITKDEGAATYTYQGPGHSSSLALPVGVLAGELAPDQIAWSCTTTVDDTSPFASHPATLEVHVQAFSGKQNGTAIKGASLAAADRGSWLPTGDPLTPWAVVRSGNVTVTDTPDAGSEGLKIQADPAAGLLGDGSGEASRRWDQAIYLPGHDPNQANADMTTAREHGPLFVALIYPAAADTVKGRDSYDNGSTWQEGTIYSSGGTTNRSPSIFWAGGRIYVTWGRGPEVVQANSNDLGASWSSPVTIVTGTNPRTVYDPRHGITFYFYVVGGNLLLKRSGNFGVDFIDSTPIGVANTIGSQTVAAEITRDGTIVVGYILTGTWTQVRSKDYGVSWA